MPGSKELIDFINKTSPEKLQVEEDLGSGYVRLNISEAQRRQAKHDIRTAEYALIELLRNSRDAEAGKIYVAFWKDNGTRKITVIDNGRGIPSGLQRKIFEPRVTSKLNRLVVDKYGVHGRGMALYSIAQNCLSSTVTQSKKGILTAIKLVIDTKALPEKANQSTWPTLDSKGRIKEGPKNFIRKCVEFNLGQPNLSVFIGTPSAILASIRKDKLISPEQNAIELSKEAKQLGLEISFRNCQRIAYGEICGPEAVLKKINYKKRNKNGERTLSSLLSQEDLALILDKAVKVVNDKGMEYFVSVTEEANIFKAGNKLKIILPLELQE